MSTPQQQQKLISKKKLNTKKLCVKIDTGITESTENAINQLKQGFEKVRIAEILDCTTKTIQHINKIPKNGQKLRKSELGEQPLLKLLELFACALMLPATFIMIF